MARLVAPKFGYARKGDHYTPKGWVVNSNLGKVHLAKRVNGQFVHAVCGQLIDTESERSYVLVLSSVNADDICVKCLGAMKAED